jgi:hypothetical protein
MPPPPHMTQEIAELNDLSRRRDRYDDRDRDRYAHTHINTHTHTHTHTHTCTGATGGIGIEIETGSAPYYGSLLLH